MNPQEILDDLLACGFTLRVDGSTLFVSPAAKLTAEQRGRITGHKEGLLALVVSSFCPRCDKRLDRGRCWRCGYRPCSRCGRDTASAFIELCVACGMAQG